MTNKRKSVLGYIGSVFGMKGTESTSNNTPRVEAKPISREDFNSEEIFQTFIDLKTKWEVFLNESNLYSETDTSLYNIITLFQEVFYSQTMFQQHFHQM